MVASRTHNTQRTIPPPPPTPYPLGPSPSGVSKNNPMEVRAPGSGPPFLKQISVQDIGKGGDPRRALQRALQRTLRDRRRALQHRRQRLRRGAPGPVRCVGPHPAAGGPHAGQPQARNTTWEYVAMVKPVRRDEHGEELSPGLWLFRPGEKVPAWSAPNGNPAALGSAPGRGPLDSPPSLPIRLVGRRKIDLTGGRGIAIG